MQRISSFDLKRILKTPWMAIQPTSTCWFIATLLVLDLALALAFVVYGHAMLAVTMLTLGVALLCVYPLPTMLFMTRAAHQLRLPGVRRTVNLSLGLYVLICMAVPTLVAALGGGQPGVAALLAGLTISACLLYATLPWILSMLVCFAPMLLAPMLPKLHLPGPTEAGFVGWFTPVVAVLAVLAAWRWWSLQRRANLTTHYLWRPLLLGLNRPVLKQIVNPVWTAASHRHDDPHARLAQRPAWLTAPVDLRHTGPRHLHRSLCVALGGTYLPLRPARRWRQLSYVLPALFVIVLLVVALTRESPLVLVRDAVHVPHLVLPDLALALIAAIMPFGFVTYLRAQWHKPNGEWTLLALLPGLGSATDLKPAMLRAMLAKPLTWLAVLWLLLIATSSMAHLDAVAMTLLLIVPPLAGLWLAMSVLVLVAGNDHGISHFLGDWLGMPALLLLACLSAWWPPTFAGASAWLAWVWLVWAFVMLVIGGHAWRQFRASPHLFALQTP